MIGKRMKNACSPSFFLFFFSLIRLQRSFYPLFFFLRKKSPFCLQKKGDGLTRVFSCITGIRLILTSFDKVIKFFFFLKVLKKNKNK